MVESYILLSLVGNRFIVLYSVSTSLKLIYNYLMTIVSLCLHSYSIPFPFGNHETVCSCIKCCKNTPKKKKKMMIHHYTIAYEMNSSKLKHLFIYYLYLFLPSLCKIKHEYILYILSRWKCVYIYPYFYLDKLLVICFQHSGDPWAMLCVTNTRLSRTSQSHDSRS